MNISHNSCWQQCIDSLLNKINLWPDYENPPCTHIPGFWEIQIWNIQSIIVSLCLIVAM